MFNSRSLLISFAGRLARSGILLPLAVYLSSVGSAHSSGYGLKETSATAMGSAYAGSAATGSDASFMSYNPASLAKVGQYDSSLSVVGIFPHADGAYSSTTSAATPAGGNGRPTGFVGDAMVPDMAARLRISPDVAVGLAIYGTFGLLTDYPAGWAGRYYADKTHLLTVDFQPTVSYQITQNVSLGAGLLVQYARGTLSSAIDMGTLGVLNSLSGSIPGAMDGGAVFKADDWGVGFTLGAMADLAPGVTLGLSYRSAVHHTMEGPLTFTLDSAGVGAAIKGATGLFANTRASAKLTTPDMVYAGLRARLAEGWTGLVEVDWTNWASFHELRIHAVNPAQPDDVTDARWDDTWFISGGLEYQPDNVWTWRAGVGFDQSPVPAATRNPRIPDSDRTWLAAGLTYHASDNIDLSLSYGHLFLSQSRIALTAAGTGNALRGNLTGKSNASAEIVGVQLNYRMPG